MKQWLIIILLSLVFASCRTQQVRYWTLEHSLVDGTIECTNNGMPVYRWTLQPDSTYHFEVIDFDRWDKAPEGFKNPINALRQFKKD